MTDPSPSEFVAAHELGRYRPEDVMRLIKAATAWWDAGPAVDFDEDAP